MVKAGYDGVAVDSLPLVTADGDRITPVLPGSALKGALRAQAERIMRTVLGIDTLQSDETRPRTAFLCQLRDRRLELPRLLFGAAGERRPADIAASDAGRAPPGGSALLFDDVVLRQSLPRQDWETIENAADPRTIVAANTSARNIAFEPAFHVTVDRWTGGAAEHLLFATLEPHPLGNGSPWQPIRVTLLLERLPADRREAAVALLLLTLRDLARGLIPIGFAGNRGMGGSASKR
jgi:hypothetical protein